MTPVDLLIKESVDRLASEVRDMRKEQRQDLHSIWGEVNAGREQRHALSVQVARIEENVSGAVSTRPPKPTRKDKLAKVAAPAAAGVGGGAIIMALIEVVPAVIGWLN